MTRHLSPCWCTYSTFISTFHNYINFNHNYHFTAIFICFIIVSSINNYCILSPQLEIISSLLYHLLLFIIVRAIVSFDYLSKCILSAYYHHYHVSSLLSTLSSLHNFFYSSLAMKDTSCPTSTFMKTSLFCNLGPQFSVPLNLIFFESKILWT